MAAKPLRCLGEHTGKAKLFRSAKRRVRFVQLVHFVRFVHFVSIRAFSYNSCKVCFKRVGWSAILVNGRWFGH